MDIEKVEKEWMEMSKNIVIVNGSPRKNGNTEILVDAFIEGAKESGNAIIKFNVGAMKINGCTDCQYCFSHPGECVQKDGMTEIYSALYNADMLVLASPVYCFGMSAQLKTMLDRMYVAASKAFPITTSALLVTYGDTDTTVVEPTVSHYKAIIKYIGWEDRGIITQPGVLNKGDIKGHLSLAKARELGSSVQ